jgi:hypothetical protein
MILHAKAVLVMLAVLACGAPAAFTSEAEQPQLLEKLYQSKMHEVGSAGGRVNGRILDPSHPALLNAIGAWLSSEYDLPLIQHMPDIVLAPANYMIDLRYRQPAASGGTAQSPSELNGHSQLVAIYDDDTETIFLPADWSGSTAGELSMLVHEMVHHVQNLAGLSFACAEEREKMAFAAQEKWLSLFGSDLAHEFDLDSMTLLVRTNCIR